MHVRRRVYLTSGTFHRSLPRRMNEPNFSKQTETAPVCAPQPSGSLLFENQQRLWGGKRRADLAQHFSMSLGKSSSDLGIKFHSCSRIFCPPLKLWAAAPRMNVERHLPITDFLYYCRQWFFLQNSKKRKYFLLVSFHHFK